MSDKDLAVKILDLVGGESNVNSVVHCVTRLRYKLKNESIAKEKEIEAIDEVQGIIKKGGQYQIVLGPGLVDRVYDQTLSVGKFDSLSNSNNSSGGNVFDKFVDIVSSIFTPVLGILAASGMIKGFLALFSAIGLIAADSTTYTIVNGIGDSMFYFMPIILGFYSMKKFGGTPMIGALIGAILIYPDINALASSEALSTMFEGSMFAADVKAYLFGIPLIVPMSGYTSSVLPIIAINALAAKVEKVSKRIYPDSISLFFIPMTTLFVASVVGLLLVGPVISIASSIVTAAFLTVLNAAPTIYGFLVAALWQVLVMFGLHWALVPMAIMEFGELMAGNTDKMVILVPTVMVCFAQIGAVLAIYFKTTDEKVKKLCIPAFITGIFGITEPAIYGITLPRKRDFILSCIAGGIGGFWIAFTSAGNYIMGGMGVFALLAFLNPSDPGYLGDVINAVIALVISFGSGFALVYFFGQKENAEVTASETEDVIAPVEGVKVSLSQINDDIFKNEVMGKTIAYKPTSNNVMAPISGKVTAVFPTKHAIGITGENNEEFLVHIGIDTVELEGSGFETVVNVGDSVNQGDLIAVVDFDYIEAKGYDNIVIVVITNEGNLKYKHSEMNAIGFEVVTA